MLYRLSMCWVLNVHANNNNNLISFCSTLSFHIVTIIIFFRIYFPLQFQIVYNLPILLFFPSILLLLSSVYLRISCLSTCLLFIYLSPVYLPIFCLSTCLLSIYLSIYLSQTCHVSCLSTCLLFIYLSPVYLPVFCLFTCHLSIYLSQTCHVSCLSTCLLFIYLSPVYLPVYLSIYLSLKRVLCLQEERSTAQQSSWSGRCLSHGILTDVEFFWNAHHR